MPGTSNGVMETPGSGNWEHWDSSLDCYWVGSLDFNFLGNKGVFHQPPKKLNCLQGVSSDQVFYMPHFKAPRSVHLVLGPHRASFARRPSATHCIRQCVACFLLAFGARSCSPLRVPGVSMTRIKNRSMTLLFRVLFPFLKGHGYSRWF